MCNRRIFKIFSIFLLFWFFSFSAFSEEKSARLTDDGKIILENEFFQITFEPQKTGRATNLFFKPWSINLTTKDGFFVDSFREIGGEGKLFDFGFLYPDYPYQAEILSDSENLAKIRFSLKIDEIYPDYSGWIFQKEYSLKKGEPFIYVSIRMINNGNEKKKFAYRPSHLVHFENQTVWYYVPDISGILIDYDPPIGSDGRGSHGLFTLYPSGAWIGCIADTIQKGIVFEFDWKYLDSIEAWLSSRAGSVAQWFYRIFMLSPGQSWETNYVIYPVQGLFNISGAKSGIVGSLMIGTKNETGKPVQRDQLKQGSTVPIKLHVYSVKDKKINYRISEKIKGNVRILKQGEIEIGGFSTAEIETPWTVPSGDTLTVISAEISDENKQLLTIEQPVETGRNIELYQAKIPDEKQYGESAGFVHGRPPVPEEVKKIDLNFVSPHQQWAKPYVYGKTKLLFVYRSHTLVHLREIVERGDFDISLLATTPEKPYQQMREIPERIKNFAPEVMLFTAFDWKSGFPPGIIDIITNWVYRGGGLVIDANLSNSMFLPVFELINQGKEIQPEKVLCSSPFTLPKVKLYEIGKGRVVILEGGVIAKGDNFPIGEYRPNPWIPGWEYNYPYLISAILWASHKEIPITFSPLKIESDLCKITLFANIPVKKVKIKTEIRNQYHQIYSSSQYNVSLSDKEYTLTIGKMEQFQEGLSIVKILVSDHKGKILGWTSGKIEKPSTIKAQINCNNAYYRNEPINIKLDIIPADFTADITGILLIKDAWNRTVWQSEILKNGSYSLNPDLKLLLDIWHEIILEVYQNGKQISEKRQLLFIFPEKNIPDDDFSVGCWGHPYGNPSGAVVSTRSAVENGIDYFYSYGGEIAADHVYRNHGHIYGPPNTNSELFLSSRLKKRDPVNLITTPSLYPEANEWLKVKNDVIKKTYDYGKNLGANVMMLDDERDLKGDFDWSETTLSHFPDWLKREYGTISELNKVWGTNYTSFDQVRPERKEKLKEDNLAPYVDFRKYTGWIVEEFYTRQPLLWVKEANPNATIGMHGIYTTSSGRPWDMSKIIPLLSITGRYNGILEEWFRTMGKNCIHGQYTGYEMGEKLTCDNRITPWKNLFHGSKWILYYQIRNVIGAGGIFQSILNYDGTARNIYRNLYNEELKEIKQGTGKLVLNSKLIDDGIVFTYSYVSCLFDRHTSSYFAAKTLVQDIGYQHNLVSYKELENYQLPENTKVIFLADCISMSNSEIESVKKFVSSGGIVIADAQTAIYDNHGVKYNISPADELFGISRSEVKYSPEKKTITFNSGSFTIWVAESGLKTTSSIPLGKTEDETPVITVNSYGKGKAIYLNLHLTPYSKLSSSGAAGEIVIEQPGAKEIEDSYKKILKEIFVKVCGIEAEIKILPENACKEIFLFSCPENKSYLFGFLPSPRLNNDTKITIVLKEEKNVYDVRNKKFIGKGKKIDYNLIPEKTGLLAILPYTVKKIEISHPAKCHQGNIIDVNGKILTTSNFADGHVIRVQVYDDKNREIPFYAMNIKCDGNSFHFNLPIDLSMEQGTYKIVVTDIMTGKNTSSTFRVIKNNGQTVSVR